MRDMRFRVWDIEERKMIKVRRLDFLGNRVRVNKDISLVLNTNDEEQKYISIMQYTGLKDKNGKEIYQGDILSYKHITYTDCSKTKIEEIEEESFIEIITYAPIASVVKPHSKNVKCLGYDSVNKECLIIDLTSDDVEIVGNVYENKDLLK